MITSENLGAYSFHIPKTLHLSVQQNLATLPNTCQGIKRNVKPLPSLLTVWHPMRIGLLTLKTRKTQQSTISTGG